MKTYLLLFLIVSLLLQFSFGEGEQCGHQAGGALCPGCLCCSKDGYCGLTEPYCGSGCQSQCDPGPYPPTPPSPTAPGPTRGDLSDIISSDQFYEMLLYMNDPSCDARGFFTYDAFITAAKSFPSFGNTGDLATRKKEIAAFFGQTAYETKAVKAGGSPYCSKEDLNTSSDYCDTQNAQWPCTPGQRYYGRGPFMLSWNYNYGPCGSDIGVDLLHNPSLVSNDSVISFKTAIWFWMTPQAHKPSCHDVITNQWQPSDADIAARRLPGYGVITNIINGELECAGRNHEQEDVRIAFYFMYCELLDADHGSRYSCGNQSPFGEGSNVFLDAAI